jgi:hypothetical protein
MLQEAWDFIVGSAGPVPASQGKAFVDYAATVRDPVIIELLAAAMERSAGTLPKAEWQTLATARSGVIARMAKALLAPGP